MLTRHFAYWPKRVPHSLTIPETHALPTTSTSQPRAIPARPAIVYYGREITYRELAPRSTLAGYLQNKLGVKRGDRVLSADAELPAVHHRLLRDPARQRRGGSRQLDARDERAAPLRAGRGPSSRWSARISTRRSRRCCARERCGGSWSRRTPSIAGSRRTSRRRRWSWIRARRSRSRASRSGRTRWRPVGEPGPLEVGAGRSRGPAVHLGDDGNAARVHAFSPHDHGECRRRSDLEPGDE